MNEKTLAILEKLIAVCKDGEAGFQLASGEVKTSELQSLFVGYSLQRSRLWRDLEAAASTLGRSIPAESGEAGRTWMMPADATTARDDQAVLSECERGEDAAMAAYAAALEEPELPPAIRAMIAAQALDVKAAHSEVHSRRTRFAPAAVQPPEPDPALTGSSSA
jgi:uncharacterized protein (TIGR02284 family)